MPDHAPTWINDGAHDREIARFVLEGDDFANRVVSRAAAELHRLTGQRCRSFAAAVESADRAVFRAAVEALYLHLKQDHHLRYEYERAYDEATGEQQVRLPATVGEEGRGTCIDLTVLFLSCLANAKLGPLYVQSRGHAVAAAWLRKPPRLRATELTLDGLRKLLAAGDVLAVECTGFAEGAPWRPHKASFGEAVEEARQRLDQLPAGEFRFALDVGRAWEEGVRPLPPASPSPQWRDRPRALDFSAFLEVKRQRFTGREWLFDEIDAWLRTGAEQALLITGDPGVGKSAVVAELVRRDPGGRVLAHHCCRADTPTTLQPGTFVRSIAAMVADRLPDYAERLRSPAVQDALGEGVAATDPGQAFEAGVLRPLQAVPAPAEAPCCLLVDALDEAQAPHAGAAGATIVQVLAGRREHFPAWLRLVATTRRDRDVLAELSGLRTRELNAEDPRNLGDIARYVNERLESRPLAERLAASGQTAERVAAVLRRKGAGNFLDVQVALDGLESGLYGFEDLDDLPPGLHGIYARFFRRHFPDPKRYGPARRVLQAVVAAREPLPEDLLARATGFDREEKLPRVLRRLAPYLRSQAGGGGQGYAVYHKSFSDWLTGDRQAAYYASPRRGHERLADACWGEYRTEGGPLSRYTLAHLPAHLEATGRWDDLQALLDDRAFLEARSRALHKEAPDARLTAPETPPSPKAIGPARSGRDLVASRPEAIRKRWETLVHFERQLRPLRPEEDYVPLIMFASQILEAELEALVLTPARSIAARLIANLDSDRAGRPQADVLRRWASKEFPGTLGTASVVLLALRRGCERRDPRVEEFLSARFEARGRDLFLSRGPSHALETIRTQFRNPAAHGTSTFPAAEYERFARLLVGNPRLGAWYENGPEPAGPGPDEALLHHLLRMSAGGPVGQSG